MRGKKNVNGRSANEERTNSFPQHLNLERRKPITWEELELDTPSSQYGDEQKKGKQQKPVERTTTNKRTKG
jgi:hypothetical protein